MRSHWALATALAVMLLASVTGSPQALAQEPGDSPLSFSVTPSRFEVRVGPGETLQFALEVINHSPEPLTLLTYVDDLDIPADELVSSDELAFTASRWMTFANGTITVPGEGDAEAIVVVDIPPDTPSGGYHAIAYFQAVRPQSAPDAEIIALGRIGATMLLEVAPGGSTLSREAFVTDTTLEVTWDNPFKPRVEANVTISNAGELHVTSGGLHIFRIWPGQATVEEKVGPTTLLRGTQHTFTSGLDDVPLFGKVSLSSEIVYQVGPSELPVIVTQASVWVIPWFLIFTVALVAALALWLMLRRRRRRMIPAGSPPAETLDPIPIEV